MKKVDSFLCLFMLLTSSWYMNAQIGFDPQIEFQVIPDVVVVPESPLESQVIFIGGYDSVITNSTYGNPAGAYPAKQWHDFIGFTPDETNSGDLGWLSINHEMISNDPNLGDGGGMTTFKIKRDPDTDSIIVVEQTLSDGRNGYFFNVDFANTVGETGMNCGGITSDADGRIWTAEEWFRTSNPSIHYDWYGGPAVSDTSDFTISNSGIPMADGQTVKKFENFNYMVEIDPREAVAIRKQYNWGRQPFEGGVILPDNQTVYLGADATPGIFSKFVAETPGDFTSGKLYAYREDDQRMRLSHQLSNTDMFSEISAFDPSTNMLFSTYTDGAGVLVHTFTNAESLDSLAFIDLASHGEPTSVAAKNGLLAIAIANDVSTADGKVLILDSDLNILNEVTTGVLPDMVAFSPDGNYIVTANEGEPNDDYTIDPEGTVTIIDISGGASAATVQHANFQSFTPAMIPGVRIFGEQPGPNPVGLYFTEYAEGSGFNKYLEIYNGSGSDVDLSAYSLSSCSNGCNTIGQWDYPDNVTFAPGTILASGDVYIVYHPDANVDPTIIDEGDQTHQYLSNGDDVYALTLAGATPSNYTIVDIIGDMGADPGSGWEVAGVANGTQNHTLVRKEHVISGNADWSAAAGTDALSSEWLVYPSDDYVSVGEHEHYNPIYSTVAQDLEPEYVAIDGASEKAYVACQENNAIAIIDLATAQVEDVFSLGFKDYGLEENNIDASDDDELQGNFMDWDNLYGMYQPDAITITEIDGVEYLLTANEGDARDYDGFSEEVRVRDLILDPAIFPNAAVIQSDSLLGRLKTTTTMGDWNNDGMHEEIYSYGARSFSIWDLSGNLVFDSKNEFSSILSSKFSDNYADNRDDDKGCEPESIAVGKVGGKTFAYIGLERSAGVMVYDITDPTNAFYVNYYNNNSYDLSPEGLIFVDGADSPDGRPYLISTNEAFGSYTGSISVYNVNGYDGKQWIEINNSNMEKMLNYAGEAVNAGATLFNRLEWVSYNPADENVYMTETGRDNPGSRWADEVDNGGVIADFHNTRALSQGTDVLSSDYVDYYGRVLKFDVSTEVVSPHLSAGPEFHDMSDVSSSNYPETHLSNPDGLSFMTVGQKTYMVIQEDLNGTSHGRMPAGVSNRTCEMFILDTDISSPTVDDLVRIAQVPLGAEITGARATPDGKTLFFNSQHPSSSNPFPYNNSCTIAINGWDRLPDNTNVNEIENESVFSVYPNPTSRIVYFNRSMDVALYTIDGQLLQVARNAKSMDIMNLSPGTYVLKNEEGDVKKLVVQ